GFPDWRWRRVQLIADEDRVAVHLRGSGTHRGPYGGLAPTRRHVNVAEFAMYRVRHGRITESSGLTDRLDLLTQLGYSVP
ncbi:MAG TPA: ester cyclase, partial [Citricoccus sp.]